MEIGRRKGPVAGPLINRLAVPLTVSRATRSPPSPSCRPARRRAQPRLQEQGHFRLSWKELAGSTVTLFAAGDGEPVQLAQGMTGDDGAFKLDVVAVSSDKVLYLVARGGTPKAAADKSPNDAIALLAVLGTSLPKKVTVNEFTTVASVWTCAVSQR